MKRYQLITQSCRNPLLLFIPELTIPSKSAIEDICRRRGQQYRYICSIHHQVQYKERISWGVALKKSIDDRRSRLHMSSSYSTQPNNPEKMTLESSASSPPVQNGIVSQSNNVVTPLNNFQLGDVNAQHKPLYEASVWLEFAQLMATRDDPINLGQGFPSWESEPFVAKAAAQVFERNDVSTCVYARTRGHVPFLQAVAKHYSPRMGRKLDPMKHILPTVGASQAIQLTMLTFLRPGDEIILIEPFFDLYKAVAIMTGATIKSVPLRFKEESGGNGKKSAGSFILDMDELASMFSEKTRILVLNSPHNPTGKVFCREEYEQIANIIRAKGPNCLVMSDEVYEHLVFDGVEHIPFASIAEDMYQRTVTLYSAGKTFSATGWKLGWIIAAPELANRCILMQQWIVFSVSSPLQQAVADILELADQPYKGFENYYSWLRSEYTRKRDIAVHMLQEIHMDPIVPQGSFFIMADTRKVPPAFAHFPEEQQHLMAAGRVEIDSQTRDRRDYNVARNILLKAGVSSIPVSSFYSPDHMHLSTNYLRFACCQKDHRLEMAHERLVKLLVADPKNKL
eukprot:CAMPEP_0184698138 /NCGR_PEP_ID=MMETSP0313-20130426/4866_1 /TAXON_ID=2792 /ORGANISM="Porphyridium aerugineum, Strain SAG 1380-2" /LENGTH=567 /DNA_ID=CAMNT_0027157035 /DNA_START=207 /DNA_END=1910 /DNA_ORIENTATION=+